MTDIILHLSCGQGPKGCEWVVVRLANAFYTEASPMGLDCEPIEPVDEPVATRLLRISGDGAEAFAAECTSTICRIGTSPFRPLPKRRNWFVSVDPARIGATSPYLRDADIRYQAFHASGPGGKHVNNTDSAVRAIHHQPALLQRLRISVRNSRTRRSPG